MKQQKTLICLFLISVLVPISSLGQQLDSLWGKYLMTEPNGENYEGFVLLPKSEAILLKVFSQKFLYAKDLPKDSLSLVFNPGLNKVKEFPIELSLIQPIKAKWSFENDSLSIQDGYLNVRFRKFRTGYVVSESQVAGFTNVEAPIYYQSERWNRNHERISKLNILTRNSSQLPSNYDLYEFRSDMPQTIIIKTEDGTYKDSLYFSNGEGKKELLIANKYLKRKDNVYSNFELNRVRLAGYFYDQVHGYEYTYYHPNEINETYVGKKFLLKCEAWYELGVKHGKWIYYKPNGEIEKTEIWKKGELKKTIQP